MQNYTYSVSVIVSRNGCLGDMLKVSASVIVLSSGRESGIAEGETILVYQSLLRRNKVNQATCALF